MTLVTLTQTENGTHLRLSNHGHRIATFPVAVQRGEDPTETAERALVEYGWTLTQQWEHDFGGTTGNVWVAHVEPTADMTNAARVSQEGN